MTPPLLPRIRVWGLLAVVLAVGSVAHADSTPQAVDAAAFEQLKSLAGRWEGTFEAPAKGAATIEYEVTSNGRAVIEHQFRGSSHAMISVFALAYDRLQASHFCAMGNQPAYRLAQDSSPRDIRMEFVGGTGLDPDKDHHANGERIEIVGPDELRVTFEFRTGHEPPTSASMRLKRVSTAALPPASGPAVGATLSRTMDNGLRCWKCGASLADYSLPLRRLEECRTCRAELHACRMCEFYDTGKAKHCRETIADEVKDKQAANFCDYFRPSATAYQAAAVSAADKAKAELEALFGRK